MDLSTAMAIAASGVKAQSARLRVTAQNLANAESTAQAPGGDPYRRRTIGFGPREDRELGVEVVDVTRHGLDSTPFELRHQPGHPAADEVGNVKYPNVNEFVELMDMREAQRSYSANLSVLETTRGMLSRTIEALR